MRVTRLYKKYKGLLWLDAADNAGVDLEDIMSSETKQYLVERKTLGYIIKEDKWGYIVLRDIDENDECEITAIPKYWKVK